jgi:WD40 repeat protein
LTASDITTRGLDAHATSLPSLHLHRVPLLVHGRCVGQLRGHAAPVCALACNAQFVVSGSHDRTLRVWTRGATSASSSSASASSSSLLVPHVTLSGHTDRIRAVCFGRGARADTLFSTATSGPLAISFILVICGPCHVFSGI